MNQKKINLKGRRFLLDFTSPLSSLLLFVPCLSDSSVVIAVVAAGAGSSAFFSWPGMTANDVEAFAFSSAFSFPERNVPSNFAIVSDLLLAYDILYKKIHVMRSPMIS